MNGQNSCVGGRDVKEIVIKEEFVEDVKTIT